MERTNPAASKALTLWVRNSRAIYRLTGEGPDLAVETPLSSGGRMGLGVDGDRIAYLGSEEALPPGSIDAQTQVLDAQDGYLAPGLIDPHTHAVFAGERSREFELRCRGATYQEIASAGGGIQATVDATRAASEEELVALALPRLRRLLEFGVTTAEVKSGYGLDLENELKMLRAIRQLQTLQPIELVPTLLCAHAIPSEHRSNRARYIDLCIQEIIPRVSEGKLAHSCDVFIEEGAFTLAEGRKILEAGKACGLTPRLHADQLSSTGAVELAVDLGASSVDHLERISEAAIETLAGSEVSAVLIPTATLFLKQPTYAPGRTLRDRGVNVALATNLNPGSAMSENVALAMGLACLQNGLTPAEAFWGFTRGSAQSLRLRDRGHLTVGNASDFIVLSEPPTALPYHLGINCMIAVVKAGKVVSQVRIPPSFAL